MHRVRFAVRLILAFLVAAGSTIASTGAALDRCWAEVRTRIELQPCLEHLLQAAERALDAALAQTEQSAKELDRVIGPRARNVETLRASQAAWLTYREAECARRMEAMSPGSGSGDVHLDCLVELTERRALDLTRP